MIIDTTTNAAEVESALNLANIQWQLEQTANDPNLTIVTDHWYPIDEFSDDEIKGILLNSSFNLTRNVTWF